MVVRWAFSQKASLLIRLPIAWLGLMVPLLPATPFLSRYDEGCPRFPWPGYLSSYVDGFGGSRLASSAAFVVLRLELIWW